MPGDKKEIGRLSELKPTVKEIFFLFLKLGILGFGGGAALISLVQQEVVDKKKWLSAEAYVKGLAVSFIPPGAVIVNVSFFTGSILRGFMGGIAAVTGIYLPSFFIVVILAWIYLSFGSISLHSGVMSGLSNAVAGVITALILKMSKDFIKDKLGAFLLIICILLMIFFKVRPYVLISGAVGFGLILWLVIKNKMSGSVPPALENVAVGQRAREDMLKKIEKEADFFK